MKSTEIINNFVITTCSSWYDVRSVLNNPVKGQVSIFFDFDSNCWKVSQIVADEDRIPDEEKA